MDIDLLVEINKGIPQPERAYFLDVPTEELVRHLKERDGSGLLFEEQSVERIESIVRSYREMGSLLRPIDGTKPVEEVTATLWNDLQSPQNSAQEYQVT